VFLREKLMHRQSIKKSSFRATSSFLASKGQVRRILAKVILKKDGKVMNRRTCIYTPTTKGNAYNMKGIDDQLQIIIHQLETGLPEYDFRMVELGLGQFNFIGEYRDGGEASSTGSGSSGDRTESLSDSHDSGSDTGVVEQRDDTEHQGQDASGEVQ